MPSHGPQLLEALRETSCIWKPELGDARIVNSNRRAVPFYVEGDMRVKRMRAGWLWIARQARKP